MILEELWRKKQSDVMRFLNRLRTWEYRQLPAIHRCSRPSRPDKARKVGYKAKQGILIYRVRIKRGDRKKRVAKGIVYGKPCHQGVKKHCAQHLPPGHAQDLSAAEKGREGMDRCLRHPKAATRPRTLPCLRR